MLTRAILLMLSLAAAPAFAQSDPALLDQLFEELQDPATRDWESVEQQIWDEWSKSGSVAMDLLLERGRDDMAAGDYEAAVEHLSALIDHAPDFAEGWNARATAYYLMDEYGLSVSDIEHVLALNPRHFGAMAGLATILERTGRPKQALTVYTKALELHPHLAGAREAVQRLQIEVGGIEL